MGKTSHKKFIESLKEKKRTRRAASSAAMNRKTYLSNDEYKLSVAEELEAKFNELFGPIDSDEDDE